MDRTRRHRGKAPKRINKRHPSLRRKQPQQWASFGDPSPTNNDNGDNVMFESEDNQEYDDFDDEDHSDTVILVDLERLKEFRKGKQESIPIYIEDPNENSRKGRKNQMFQYRCSNKMSKRKRFLMLAGVLQLLQVVLFMYGVSRER